MIRDLRQRLAVPSLLISGLLGSILFGPGCTQLRVADSTEAPPVVLESETVEEAKNGRPSAALRDVALTADGTALTMNVVVSQPYYRNVREKVSIDFNETLEPKYMWADVVWGSTWTPFGALFLGVSSAVNNDDGHPGSVAALAACGGGFLAAGVSHFIHLAVKSKEPTERVRTTTRTVERRIEEERPLEAPLRSVVVRWSDEISTEGQVAPGGTATVPLPDLDALTGEQPDGLAPFSLSRVKVLMALESDETSFVDGASLVGLPAFVDLQNAAIQRREERIGTLWEEWRASHGAALRSLKTDAETLETEIEDFEAGVRTARTGQALGEEQTASLQGDIERLKKRLEAYDKRLVDLQDYPLVQVRDVPVQLSTRLDVEVALERLDQSGARLAGLDCPSSSLKTMLTDTVASYCDGYGSSDQVKSLTRQVAACGNAEAFDFLLSYQVAGALARKTNEATGGDGLAAAVGLLSGMDVMAEITASIEKHPLVVLLAVHEDPTTSEIVRRIIYSSLTEGHHPDVDGDYIRLWLDAR